ncbi:hypothetical protein C8C94_5101 [Acidovorax sp. 94]|uniref:hypothetical protein n=1 Tax=Acidovorax sp. 94 TaxID=2135633 RepID=UPI00095B69A9|nr:hypothetical protein [Acidovorax sp. 94]OJV63604.1 MAG: hypothetical protein BGO35_04235 [Burkholderiales bacterium 64-34]RKR52908.1 hypothetical protein C8C94_5101 [Acidovorax sp. 94]
MKAWTSGQRHQGHGKSAQMVRAGRPDAVAPRGIFLTRYQNFKLLHLALGSDVLLTATKAHVSKDRAERILAQEEVIDDQLAEHMGRMIQAPSWFDTVGAVLDDTFVERIKSFQAEDEDETHNPMRETTMTALRVQSDVNEMGATSGGGLSQQGSAPAAPSSVAANADQRAAGPSRGVEDRYDLFAAWLSKEISSRPGLKSEITSWLGIELWMLNGWLSARRRMFLNDVEMLSNALLQHGHSWGNQVRGKFDEFVIRQLPTARGRTRRSQSEVGTGAGEAVNELVSAAAQASASGSSSSEAPPPAAKPALAPSQALAGPEHAAGKVAAGGAKADARQRALPAGPGAVASNRVPAAPASQNVAGSFEIVEPGNPEPVMAEIVTAARSIAATLEAAMNMLAASRQKK